MAMVLTGASVGNVDAVCRATDDEARVESLIERRARVGERGLRHGVLDGPGSSTIITSNHLTRDMTYEGKTNVTNVPTGALMSDGVKEKPVEPT